MSPGKRRREERLRLEAEAMGMTLPEARLWWASQKEGYLTGRPALRHRVWLKHRAEEKTARAERTKNGTATEVDKVRNWYDAFNASMQKEKENPILYGSGPRPIVLGEKTYETLKTASGWPGKTAQDYFLWPPEPTHVSLDVSKPYRPERL